MLFFSNMPGGAGFLSSASSNPQEEAVMKVDSSHPSFLALFDEG